MERKHGDTEEKQVLRHVHFLVKELGKRLGGPQSRRLRKVNRMVAMCGVTGILLGWAIP